MIASFIIILQLLGFVSLSSAITSLYIAGILLIIAEVAVVSFGLIALNGVIALYAAYAMQSGSDLIFGIPIGWSVLFGIAFVEISIIASVVAVYMWIRKQKTTTGTEGMIGQSAQIIEWNKKSGSVRFEGEIWKAKSDKELELKPNDSVNIDSVNKLNLTITAC